MDDVKITQEDLEELEEFVSNNITTNREYINMLISQMDHVFKILMDVKRKVLTMEVWIRMKEEEEDD
ncbi:MAG: hypothetical protein GY853_16575 [PVC group bacterium]|nr:hypothetical protein [PVC group bacterium]